MRRRRPGAGVPRGGTFPGPAFPERRPAQYLAGVAFPVAGQAAVRARTAVRAPAFLTAAPRSPVAADPANDQARNLDELRRIADRFDGPDVSRAAVAARLRNDADALTFFARLRRSGMSDAAVAAALFGHRPHAEP